MKNHIESVIKNGFRKFGIEISYRNQNSDLYGNCLAGALSLQKDFNIVQVGANDGKFGDPIYKFVKLNKEYTNIILIEPLESLIPPLKKNYAYHPSSEILNKAIGENDRSTVRLYRVKKEYWNAIDAGYGEDWPDYRVPTGVTTANKSKIIQWVSQNIDSNSDPTEIIEGFDVETIRPKTVIERSQHIGEVHLLQVDTEAMDDKVVYSFLQDDIYPDIINIEKKHLSQKRENAYDSKLSEQGYNVYDYTNSEKLALKQVQIP